MTTTAILGLGLISSQQNQPEVTLNELVMRLQALHTGAKALTNNPPVAIDGDVYIVGTVPTGAWVGKANKVAVRFGSKWLFVPDVDSSGSNIPMGVAQEGLTVYLQSEGGPVTWTGTHWYGTDTVMSST